jgi:hypothetical protein
MAYLVLLRVEIARFTRIESTRLCCSDPHLMSQNFRFAIFSGQPLAATLSYAVRTFLQCVVSHTTLTRRPCGMHQRRPSELHLRIIASNACFVMLLSQLPHQANVVADDIYARVGVGHASVGMVHKVA